MSTRIRTGIRLHNVDPWLIRPPLAANASALRLFCFHCAGGAATEFAAWPLSPRDGLEVLAVQLPGRENRLTEAPIGDLDQLVEAVIDGLGAKLQPPFAFFGHCFGGLLAFEIARRLDRLGRVGPVHLSIAGHRAPQLPQRNPRIAHLGDSSLVDELRRLQGTSEVVLTHPELLQLILPAMRNDYRAAEAYQYREAPALRCPILALGATQDPDTNAEELAAWEPHTQAGFSVKMLSGDHYFVTRQAAQVLELVVDALGSWR